MGFSIVHIKRTWRRRTVLILLSVPVILLTWMNEVGRVTWGCIRDYPKAFKACWRGY